MRQRETIASDHPDWLIQVTDDGSRTLISSSGPVAFHSASGAVTETEHVYLRNGGVSDRIACQLSTSVLEIGLGTAMGLLMTLDAARANRARLVYTAVECQWLSAGLIRQLEPWSWVSCSAVVTEFLQWRESLPESVPEGSYHWLPDDNTRVRVDVCDARHWRPQAGETYDAVYFDPFAPDCNQELWQPSVMTTMRESLSRGGKLVSYCVSRKVRDDLKAAGFDVRTVRGPKGGKRDVLVAEV